MQAEVNVATIPRMTIKEKRGIRDYGVLLTNHRTVFIYVGKESAGETPPTSVLIGGLLGGGVGASLAIKASGWTPGDPEPAKPRAPLPGTLNAEALASRRNNLTIAHASIVALDLRKQYGDYVLTLDYRLARGKVARLEANAVPPAELYDQGKASGLVGPEIARNYARAVQASFLAALPPDVTARTHWDL